MLPGEHRGLRFMELTEWQTRGSTSPSGGNLVDGLPPAPVIGQPFQQGTSPLGAVVLFGLCLPGRGAKHSRAFWGQGGQK